MSELQLFEDPDRVIAELQQLRLHVTTLAESMQARVRLTHDGKRNIRKSLGYQDNPSFEDFHHFYVRNDIAGRIIDLPVDSTWSGEVDVQGFAAWGDLNRRLSLTSRFAEADRLAGLGQYSVLLIGLKQEGDQPTRAEQAAKILESPVDRIRDLDDILFLRQYPEPAARIEKFNENASSEDFLKPEFYRFDFGYKVSPQGESGRTAVPATSVAMQNVKVHASRVIHLASGQMFGDVYGDSRLLRIYDRLFDIEKVVGGSAEMFWQGADRMAVAQMNSGETPMQRLTTSDKDKIRAEMEKLFAGLERLTFLQGGELKWAPSVQPDPRGIFEVLISLICGAVGIPQRILLGSERGELSSIEDRENYAETISARRSNFAWPHVLVQFLKRLDKWGVLGEPIDAMVPKWPEVEHMTLKEKADIRHVNAQTIAQLDTVVNLAEQKELRRAAGLPGDGPEDPDMTLDENDPEVLESFRIAQNVRKLSSGIIHTAAAKIKQLINGGTQ